MAIINYTNTFSISIPEGMKQLCKQVKKESMFFVDQEKHTKLQIIPIRKKLLMRMITLKKMVDVTIAAYRKKIKMKNETRFQKEISGIPVAGFCFEYMENEIEQVENYTMIQVKNNKYALITITPKEYLEQNSVYIENIVQSIRKI